MLNVPFLVIDAKCLFKNSSASCHPQTALPLRSGSMEVGFSYATTRGFDAASLAEQLVSLLSSFH